MHETVPGSASSGGEAQRIGEVESHDSLSEIWSLETSPRNQPTGNDLERGFMNRLRIQAKQEGLGQGIEAHCWGLCHLGVAVFAAGRASSLHPDRGLSGAGNSGSPVGDWSELAPHSSSLFDFPGKSSWNFTGAVI